MAEKREFLLGMLMGSAIGAAVALLYAPQAGDDTRDLLRQKAGEAKEKAADLAGGVKTTVVESAEAAKARVADVADTVKTRVTDAAGTVRERVGDVTDSVKGKVGGVADTVATSTREMIDRGRNVVETKKAQVTAAVEAGKQAYDQKRTELEADVQQDLDNGVATSSPAGSGTSTNVSPNA